MSKSIVKAMTRNQQQQQQQKQGTEKIVIAYASKTIQQLKRELFATVHFTQFFENYLIGPHFSIITDNRAFDWIYSFKETDGMVAQWIEELKQLNFDIKHRAGKKSHLLSVCRA